MMMTMMMIIIIINFPHVEKKSAPLGSFLNFFFTKKFFNHCFEIND